MGLLLLMAFAVFRLPPWLPLFAIESNGVDPSWQMVLNEAVSNDWVFGRDLFFTYGPFGFIHTRMYHPGTWAVLIAAWLGISVIIADLVWRVSGHGRLSFVGRTLFGIAMLEFMSRDTMAVCFSLHALVFLEAVGVAQFSRVAATAEMVSFSASRLRAVSIIGTLQIFRLTLSILLLAALPWAKFSYFVTVAFLGCALVAVGTLQKQIPWRAVLLFAACPLAWLMSGAMLVECREFIVTGFQLASGYSAAMGLAPESAAGFVILVSSALVVLVLPIWLASRLRLHDWRLSVLAMLFFHGLLFIAWKSCFVRYHAERLPVFVGTVFPLLAYGWLVTGFSKNPSCATGSASADSVETVSSWKHWQSQWHTFLRRVRATEVRWSFPALLATVVVLVSAGVIERVQPGTLDEITNHATAPLRDQVLAVAESVKNPGWRQSTHETQLQKIREANPIPDVDGSVDVFPSKLIVGFAHGLEMRPRPILQSYAAFTPALIERDAQHFRNTTAPDHVLISVGEIDGRLPTLEDSRAWFELLSNYDLADSSGDLLKLSRRKQSSLVHGTESAWRKTAGFGEQVHLPPELTDLVWCRIHIEPSLAGHVASIAYRLPELRLRVQYGSGAEQEFRLLPEAARAGFIVNPRVVARDDLIRLWQWRDGSALENAGTDEHVASLVCFVAGEDWARSFFRMIVKFELYECSRRIELMPDSVRPANLARELDRSFKLAADDLVGESHVE